MAYRSSYFASLVSAPIIIDVPGEYVTRVGEIVIVEAITNTHPFGCVGVYSNGLIEGWHRSGRLYADRRNDNDIVSKL